MKNLCMKNLCICLLLLGCLGCHRPPFEKTRWRIERIVLDGTAHDFDLGSDSCVTVEFERARRRRGYFMGRMRYSSRVADRSSDYYHVRDLRFTVYFLRKDGEFESHLNKKRSFSPYPYSSSNKITGLLANAFDFGKGSYSLHDDRLTINGEADYRLVSDTTRLKRRIQVFLSR